MFLNEADYYKIPTGLNLNSPGWNPRVRIRNAKQPQSGWIVVRYSRFLSN